MISKSVPVLRRKIACLISSNEYKHSFVVTHNPTSSYTLSCVSVCLCVCVSVCLPVFNDSPKPISYIPCHTAMPPPNHHAASHQPPAVSHQPPAVSHPAVRPKSPIDGSGVFPLVECRNGRQGYPSQQDIGLPRAVPTQFGWCRPSRPSRRSHTD